jgi:hypothetical protein
MEHQTKDMGIDDCLSCATECEACISECLSMGDKKYLKCIELCRDCADICVLSARFYARNSAYGDALFELCKEICSACAKECDKLGLTNCAEKCRNCTNRN